MQCLSESKSFSVGSTQARAVSLLKEIGIDSPMLDAQLLLGHVLKCSRIDVQLLSKRELSENEVTLFFALLRRRLAFEPMAYILGKKEFFGHEFSVSNDCLIPRPDTESVVEKSLALLSLKAKGPVYDLCTGSGAIALTLLKERASLHVFASDISEKALAMAKENAKNLEVYERVTFLKGDLFKPFQGIEKAFLIVANPPYIASSKIPKLSPSVRDYEPHLALNGGEGFGIDFYRRILEEAPDYLTNNGYLVLELGFDQSEVIKDLVDARWHLLEFFNDLGSNIRGIVLQKK